MSSNQPKKIYRYQRFSTSTLQALCHDKLYFADPTVFNDPFDCQPTVESDSNRDTLRQILTKLVSRRVENESIESLNKAKLNGKKALNHAKKLGKQAATNELSSIEYHATNPDYECSVYEAECWLLTNQIQRELVWVTLFNC